MDDKPATAGATSPVNADGDGGAATEEGAGEGPRAKSASSHQLTPTSRGGTPTAAADNLSSVNGNKTSAASSSSSQQPPQRHSLRMRTGDSATGESAEGAPLRSSAELEQQFEDEFSKHLQKRSTTQKVTYGAVGVGGTILGGIGALTMPFLVVPGLVVAAASGSGFLLQKGKWDKHRHCSDPSGEPKEQARPSLTRLRYLVKWGHWQLLEYEDENPEYRCLVLDEVVRAFSPWVQRMYLLRAQGNTNEANAACREGLQRLAPLYYFLQRRAAMEAVMEEARLVATAFDSGRADYVAGERCRVIFPTILETISILDRLSPAIHAQLVRETSMRDKEHGPFSSQKTPKREWLQRIVDTIRNVLVRKDVQEALQNPKLLQHPPEPTRTEPENEAEAKRPGDAEDGHASDSSTPRRKAAKPEVPPEGAEEDELEAAEYFSFSGESDTEDGGACASSPSRGRRPRGPGGMPAQDSAGSADAMVQRVNFKERVRRFPRGDADHQWQVFDQSQFNVRSETYLTDKKKAPSGPSMLELLNVDWILVPPSGPVHRTTLAKDFCYAVSRQDGEKRFLLVQNWVFPPYQCIFTCALDPEAIWARASDSPQALLWKRFMEMSSYDQTGVIKVIMSCENGPWLVKRAIPRKPVIIGRKVKMNTFYEPGDYLEVVVDVATGKGEQVATSIVLKALNRLTLAFTSVIEARTEDELPEVGLFCASITNLNLDRVPHPEEG